MNKSESNYIIPIYHGTSVISPTDIPLSPIRHHNPDRSLNFALRMDSSDELARFRDEFYYPKDMVYLCGNSLGLQPKKTEVLMQREMKKWATIGVGGHWSGEQPWFTIEDAVSEAMAPLVGARLPAEVTVMNSLSVNLQLLLAAFYKPTTRRYKVLMEHNTFPSDLIAVISHLLTIRDMDPEKTIIQVGSRPGENAIRTEDIVDLLHSDLGQEIALVLFNGVHFMTGQLLDLETITREAHSSGCLVGFDLAHAVGNVPLLLHDWGVDFACWCTYKYLNSGPGNVSGIFVHEKFHDMTMQQMPRLLGWWGREGSSRFHLSSKFEPRKGAAGFQLSTPSSISCIAVLASLELFKQVSMEKLRQKSLLLTSYLEYLLQEQVHLMEHFEIITPMDPTQRGCQLSIRILKLDMNQVMNKLQKEGIICDEREPDIIRITPVPLYNSFEDVWKCVECIKKIFK
jgi:kynureninase